ncbi:MAG: hypothetical protein L6265_04495 [Thermoplasmatales archaeon]|nr:hypothetical protein [Thermoplasmatales archaeon]
MVEWEDILRRRRIIILVVMSRKKSIVLAIIILLIVSSLGVYLYKQAVYCSYNSTHVKINFSCEKFDSGFVIKINPSVNPAISVVSYKIEYKEDGVVKVADSGTLSSIYQHDFDFLLENNLPFNNISFTDVELDERMTAGDYFLIRNSLGKSGFIFKLESNSPHYTIDSSMILSEDVPIASQNVTASNPENKFTMLAFGDDANVTISKNHSAFSAYPCLDDEPFLIGVTIENNGNVTLQHVLVEFYENDSYIGSMSKPVINPNTNARFTVEHIFDTEGEYNIIVKVFVFSWSTPIIANATVTCMLEIPPPV